MSVKWKRTIEEIRDAMKCGGNLDDIATMIEAIDELEQLRAEIRTAAIRAVSDETIRLREELEIQRGTTNSFKLALQVSHEREQKLADENRRLRVAVRVKDDALKCIVYHCTYEDWRIGVELATDALEVKP